MTALKTRTTILLLALSAALASLAPAATVLIGWHTPDASGDNLPGSDSTPDTTTTGITGLLSGGREFEPFEGSTDQSYGTIPIPGSPLTTGNRIKIRLNDTLDVSITNTTGADLQLNFLHFDYSSVFANSPTSVRVNYLPFPSGNSLGSTNVQIFSVSGLTPGAGNNNDFLDYDVDIAAALADSILGHGETAVFRFSMADAGASGTAGSLDNIAISGGPVPEPGTLTLLSALLALGLRRRSRL